MQAGDPEHQHDAGVDAGAVEQRPVPGDQEAEAVGRAQHLGHDHADDHQRAAEPQRGHDGRQARGQGDVEDLLGAGGPEGAGGLGERRAERGHAGHRGQHGGDERVDRGEGDLRLRAQAEPHHHHRVEHDQRHRVGAAQHRQQHAPRRRRGRRRAGPGGCRRRRRWRRRPGSRRSVVGRLPRYSRRSATRAPSASLSGGTNRRGTTPARGSSSQAARMAR